MKKILSITKNIKVYAFLYALLLSGLIVWLVIASVRDVPPVSNSDIPSYSLQNIEAVNDKLQERRKLEPLPVTDINEVDFGKDEPFR